MLTRCRIVVGLGCALAILLLMPGSAAPWGWATHTYLVTQLGVTAPDAMYGALLPDVGQVMDPTVNDYMHDQTTLKFSKAVAKGFQMDLDETVWGVATHNERWGADSTAHNPLTGYTTLKSPVLVSTTGLQTTLRDLLLANGIPTAQAEAIAAEFAPVVAHEAIEYAVDLQVRDHQALNSGILIYNAADTRADEVPELLVRTYATNFAARFKLSIPEASALLVAGEAAWQAFMMQYGSLLAPEVPTDYISWYLAQLGSVRLSNYIEGLTGVALVVDPMILLGVLQQAFTLTAPDYLQALEETTRLLQWNMSRRIREIE